MGLVLSELGKYCLLLRGGLESFEKFVVNDIFPVFFRDFFLKLKGNLKCF